MTANMKVKVQGLQKYEMRDAGDGPATLLTNDGFYALKLNKVEAKPTKDDEPFLSLAFVVQDTDAQGAVIYSNMFVSGEWESGPQKGQSRARTLLDLLTSAGKDATVKEIVTAGEVDLAKAAAELTGTTCFARVAQRPGLDGKVRSEPIFYIKQAKYDDSRKTGVNFRVPPRTQSAPRGAVSRNGAANGAIGTPVATDAIAADV